MTVRYWRTIYWNNAHRAIINIWCITVCAKWCISTSYTILHTRITYFWSQKISLYTIYTINSFIYTLRAIIITFTCNYCIISYIIITIYCNTSIITTIKYSKIIDRITWSTAWSWSWTFSAIVCCTWRAYRGSRICYIILVISFRTYIITFILAYHIIWSWGMTFFKLKYK